MSIRMRNLLYGSVLMAALVFVVLLCVLLSAMPGAAQEIWPAPVVAGGAMPVQWFGITNPTQENWIGLFPPEGSIWDYIEWVYVSCSYVPHVARSAGTCGFVIPSTVPPGIYELRLYGDTLLATSPRFEVLDGGWR